MDSWMDIVIHIYTLNFVCGYHKCRKELLDTLNNI